jgi:hypothetical protein
MQLNRTNRHSPARVAITAAKKRDPAERILPANLEAERCVLASLICEAKGHTAALVLSPGDFSSYSHRQIYKVIQKRASAGESTDIIAVNDELGEDLDAAGGAAYLGELLNRMYVGPDICNCVRIIREKAVLREIASLGEWAWTANRDASQVLDRVRILSARIEQGFEHKAKSLRQCQSRNTGGGKKAGGLPHGGRPWAAGFSGSGDELHRCVERGGEQGGFLRRMACQVLPLIRLGEGASKLRMLPLISFETGRKTQTRSSVQDHSLV